MDVLIDASWMSRWSLYSIKSTPTFFANTKEKDSDRYLKQLAINFKRIMNELEPVLTHDSKIIYALDYASWRKTYQTNKDGEVYKGNRVKDEALMDWSIWSQLNIEFGKILEKFGVIFAHHKGLEADDTAYIWSRMLNKIGRSCVLIASDGDWKQLISGNTYYLKKRGSKNVGYDFVKIPEPKQKTTRRRRSFSTSVTNKPVAYRLLESNYDSILENPYTFIFDKIVYGDKKDNIFPIYSMPSKKDKEENDKKQSEVELLLLEGLSEDQAKEIVDSKYRDLWEKSQLKKFKSKFKKENGSEADEETLRLKKVEISSSKRKHVRKKPNKGVYEPLLDTLGVVIDNFDIFYDQAFINSFTRFLITDMNDGYYDENLHKEVIAQFNLNVKLLHLHKRNIPHNLIKDCLRGWDEKKIIDHNTNVYDLFDENNIVPQSTLTSIDLMNDQYEGITNEDFFEW